MSRITKFMDRVFYPEFNDNWDDDIFREIILNEVKPEYYCLDYGAGRGNVEQMNFKGIAKFIAGIDPSEDVYKNPYLDEAKQMDLTNNNIPYEDRTFDLVFSDNVMEHIQDPAVVLAEISRVLKPGGVFLAKTPNAWHYVPAIARLTPTWFHQFYNKLRGRESFDTFPTTYRLNSSKAVRKHAGECDFLVQQIQLIEGRPEYLRLTAITYIFGLLYERIVNLTELLSSFRCVMISKLEKKM